MVNLNQPITWGKFKELPKHLQEEYLKNLQDRFNVNCSSLSEMFDIHKQTIRNFCKSASLGVDFPVGHRMSTEQQRMWHQFLGLDLSEGSEQHPESDDDDAADVEQCLGESDSDTNFERDESNNQTVMTNFTLCFQGKLNVNMISNSLLRIIGNDSSGEIKIVCRLQQNS